jgi:hypothetical protein
LRVLLDNPRYFTDGSGKAVFLTGSHTWDNRQDMGARPFAWAQYLTRLRDYNHNFVRFWVWEQPKGITTSPDPAEPLATLTPELFARTGPGLAADGGLQFDLTRYNQPHFDRVRERIIAAGKLGIYMSIMLFDGWSLEQKSGGANPWTYHPFNKNNNVNGIDGDPDGDQRGSETHTLQIPAVTRIQEAYVRKVIDTVSDLDNVLYEVSNESNGDSHRWQYHMINYVKSYEATKAKQHPVGMTVAWPGGSNASLFNSPADWISPNRDGGYTDDPPAATGNKVIVSDTDHLWGIGGDRAWAWKSFTRGLNVIYMDPWDGEFIPVTPSENLRVNMGHLLSYARRMHLAVMKPYPGLASTGYCLARPGSTYLVYAPHLADGVRSRALRWFLKRVSPWVAARIDVDLSAAAGRLAVEWFNPRTGELLPGGLTTGGHRTRFRAPFGGDAVLYLASGGAQASEGPE